VSRRAHHDRSNPFALSHELVEWSKAERPPNKKPGSPRDLSFGNPVVQETCCSRSTKDYLWLSAGSFQPMVRNPSKGFFLDPWLSPPAHRWVRRAPHQFWQAGLPQLLMGWLYRDDDSTIEITFLIFSFASSLMGLKYQNEVFGSTTKSDCEIYLFEVPFRIRDDRE
jgi:hypothetical protein